jgi:hypothetical protein
LYRARRSQVGDPDLIDPSYTMSWHKPNGTGKICAYCGATMRKLHPTKDVSVVLVEITTKAVLVREFFHIESLCCHSPEFNSRQLTATRDRGGNLKFDQLF